MKCQRVENVHGILEYILRAKWAVIIIVVITFMSHGSFLFSERIGMDTEFIIEGIHNFDEIGRPGLIWLAKLLGLSWFNLFYAQALTILFMIFIPIVFGYLFYISSRHEEYSNVTLLVLGLSFAVSPFWATQIYFLNQSAQVTLACILIAISILVTEKARHDISHKWHYLVLAFAFAQIAFSCYQVLIMIYIMGVAAVFLFSSLKEKRTLKQDFGWILYHMVIFLLEFAVYMIIVQTFYMSGDSYLENQIQWGKSTFAQCLENCISAIGTSLGNNPPYYTGLYGVFSLILLVITGYQWITQRNPWKSNSVLFFLVELFLVFTPFIFIFMYGGEIMDRMQLVMPLSQGAVLYLSVLLLTKESETKSKLISICYKCISILLIAAIYKNTMTQMSFTNRLYYTDVWRYQYDKNLAHDIYVEVRNTLAEEQIDENGFDNVLVLGYPEMHYNSMCIYSLVMGQSIFSYNVQNDTIGRNRIFHFMKEMGYPLQIHFTDEETEVFNTYFEDLFSEQVTEMSSYPQAGYVQYVSAEEYGMEYVIVKLGDDWKTWEKN